MQFRKMPVEIPEHSDPSSKTFVNTCQLIPPEIVCYFGSC